MDIRYIISSIGPEVFGSELRRMVNVIPMFIVDGIISLINGGPDYRLCDGYKFTTYRMNGARFESGIRKPLDLAFPDYILSNCTAYTIALEDINDVPLYVEMSRSMWNRLIKTYGTVLRNRNRDEEVLLNRLSVKHEWATEYLKRKRFNIKFKNLLTEYLIDKQEPVELSGRGTSFRITCQCPPRGLIDYDFQNDKELFEGCYYIPVSYGEFIRMKRTKKMRDVNLYTQPFMLRGKCEYALKVYDDKFYGNISHHNEYLVGPFDGVVIGKYIKK